MTELPSVPLMRQLAKMAGLPADFPLTRMVLVLDIDSLPLLYTGSVMTGGGELPTVPVEVVDGPVPSVSIVDDPILLKR